MSHPKTPDFIISPTEIVMDKRLTLIQLKVLLTILSFRNRTTNLAFPKREQISVRCGLPVCKISKATTDLVKLGWIEKQGSGGFSKATKYKLTIPETVTYSVTVTDSVTPTVTDSVRGKEQINEQSIDTNVSMVISEKSTNDDEYSESNSDSLKIESDIPVCPHREIIDCYKKVLPEAIHPRTWDGARMTALKSRWRESKNRQSIDWWRRFFEYIRQSDFLMGRALALNRQPFEIRLDWIVKKENFNKIIDGVYEKRQRTA